MQRKNISKNSSTDFYVFQNFPKLLRLLKAPNLALVLLLFSLLMQRSNAQEEWNSSLPGYNFSVAVPEASDVLTLPKLPLYDRDNTYLQVRDSSKDWYQDGPPGEITPLLDPNQRILPDLQHEDVLLDTRFVPIPRFGSPNRDIAAP